MALNLNLLRSFVAVAAAGSVSGAAKVVYISQPALSKAVRELELQVGLPLLERGARGVKLTEAGETLYEHGRAIFSLEREAEEALMAHKNLGAVTLRIGASTTIATYFLPQLVNGFRQLHPSLKVRLVRKNTNQIEALLSAYELDVALVEGPPHDPRLDSRVWQEEELVVVAAPNHPLATKANITPEDLRTAEWIVREPGSGTREVVESALGQWGLPPADALEIGSAEAIKHTVAAGLGIAVVSREAAADQLTVGKLRIIHVPGLEMHRPFWLLRVRNRPISPAARAFEQFITASRTEPLKSA